MNVLRDAIRNPLRLAIRRTIASRWQYNFDGIDDYGSIPPITLEGDFEISLYATSDAGGISVTLGDTGDSNTRGFYRLNKDTTFVRLGYRDGTFLNASVDFKVPVGEGAEYKVTRIGTGVNFYINNQIVATSTTVIKPVVIDTVGARGVADQNFWNGNIRNVYFNDLSNPSNSRYYPLDDSWNNNPIIRQSLPHNHKTDGTESFDSDGAIWVDYETESAPQYAGVTGYETLAERAVLSGLSEHDEAVASCREGLVRNGDLRFGDNGQWVLQSDWSIVNDEVYCDTDGTPGNRDLTQFEVMEVGTKYIISLNISSYTSGSLYLYYGSSSFLGNAQGNVEFTFTPTVNRIVLFGNPFVGAISDITVRKETDQQVLTPYVNHGEAINFNEENWENV